MKTSEVVNVTDNECTSSSTLIYLTENDFHHKHNRKHSIPGVLATHKLTGTESKERHLMLVRVCETRRPSEQKTYSITPSRPTPFCPKNKLYHC
jgi:hypothetical protein